MAVLSKSETRLVHTGDVLLSKLSNLNNYSSSENGFTFSTYDITALFWPTLPDWLIDLCWGVGSALFYPWMLIQLWEQLHGKSVITGFLDRLLSACLDLEKDICSLSEHAAKGPMLITDGCSVRQPWLFCFQQCQTPFHENNTLLLNNQTEFLCHFIPFFQFCLSSQLASVCWVLAVAQRDKKAGIRQKYCKETPVLSCVLQTVERRCKLTDHYCERMCVIPQINCVVFYIK